MDAEYWLKNLGDEGYSRSGLPKRTSRKKTSWITVTASGRLDWSL